MIIKNNMKREIAKIKILIANVRDKVGKLGVKIINRQDTFDERSMGWQKSLKGEYWEQDIIDLTDEFNTLNTVKESLEDSLDLLNYLESKQLTK